MNVHIFDGQLKDFQVVKNKFSIDDKKKMFNELLECLSDNGKKGLTLIIQDIQSKPNFDETNNMYADDILAEICDYVIKESKINDENMLKDVKTIIGNIDEQLGDMFTSGICPQGRVIRLHPVYYSILDVEMERKSVERKEEKKEEKKE
jgi:hypothetical protein